MASLLGIFGIGDRLQKKAVHGILNQLDRKKASIRMEIEKVNIRFTTMIAFKHNSVVVAKPPALDNVLKVGQFVRFKVPGQEQQAIRMVISTPNLNLKNGSPVFLCTPPNEFAESAHRANERFDTRRFNNIQLRISGFAEGFRILDLSTEGCRIHTSFTNSVKVLPKGKTINDAWIQMGNKARVELINITPRTHHEQAVGMEFSVKSGEKDLKLMTHLVALLDKQQKESIRAESF